MQVQDQLSKVWTQIAYYFKNYGDYLIFETLNEVHSGNWGAVANTAAYRNEQDILFDWNQAALSAIRATGGNNAARFVAVPALGSTEPSYVINAHNRQKLLPNDPGHSNNKLIVSVHYYHPWRYTVADVTSQDPNGTLLHTWGTTSERAHPGNAMRSLKTTFLDNGIAAYIGEWGAQTNVRANMSEEIRNTHIEYIATVAGAASTNGIIPMYWDDGGNFRMLSRSNGRPATGFHTQVYTAMINAIKRK
jgi:aryl-phospho-beta-D-glucosidase BglC (GH1 family)